MDPVTVVDVDDGRKSGELLSRSNTWHGQRKLSRSDGGGSSSKNFLKSHIHGTNAFMVHLSSTGEYLGLGHFHRPSDRKPNPYARFGHHYTHTFFTISDVAPYRLRRLSPEFVLPSLHPSQMNDAEIIQFASGLDFGFRDPNRLVIAFGINDCEGAAMYLDLEYINSLLRPVGDGKEVIDLMKPLA